jgi:cephalosporin hydroxylase
MKQTKSPNAKKPLNPVTAFEAERAANVALQGGDAQLRDASLRWMLESAKYKYTYNFTWMGRPIIQFPQDILAMQEIIWSVKPDMIVETGIAHGGSLVFYSSMLELLGGDGIVVGVDIDIREHNRAAIESHPMAKRIRMIQGSSTDEAVVDQVRRLAEGRTRVVVTLDSNHTHEHVLQELWAYSPLVTKGSYLVVFDTTIADTPDGFFPDRAWDRHNNPKTAVHSFLRATDRFEIDRSICGKLLITVARDGYLRCVRD